jgi:hypothetical protein
VAWLTHGRSIAEIKENSEQAENAAVNLVKNNLVEFEARVSKTEAILFSRRRRQVDNERGKQKKGRYIWRYLMHNLSLLVVLCIYFPLFLNS